MPSAPSLMKWTVRHMRILFDSKLSQFKTPFGTLKQQETCTLHILIPCSCRTTAVCLVLQAENAKYEPLVYVGEELSEIHILGKAVAFQSDVI